MNATLFRVRRLALLIAAIGALQNPARSLADEPLLVGLAETEITPPIVQPVWLAGFQQNRRATGIHDPLMARAVVLKHGEQKLALVSVDLIGLQYPVVERIRARLPGWTYCLVSSTHNHEGPDVIGLWGPGPFKTGVDPAYLELVIARVVEAVQAAERASSPVSAAFGTIKADELLHDSRLPKVYDGVLRVLSFRRAADGKLAGLLVQWNCHPEALGRRNTLITADFPAATVVALRKKYGCPVAYFSGAVGGLMTPADGHYRDADNQPLVDETYPFSDRYGEEVALAASRAIDAAEPIQLTPIQVAAKAVAVPLDNVLYQLARSVGVLRRQGLIWSGDGEQLGRAAHGLPQDRGQRVAVETEVACLRLGQLLVACIPGELYPELVYGQYPLVAETGVDFPDAPLEPTVAQIMGRNRWMLLGLANDEIGYIIPKRQWDQRAPYAYGRPSGQYGEINSCGPDVAPSIMRALQRRVKELEQR
jgi:hypothetical protein